MQHETTQDTTTIDNLYNAILQTQYHSQVCVFIVQWYCVFSSTQDGRTIPFTRLVHEYCLVMWDLEP